MKTAIEMLREFQAMRSENENASYPKIPFVEGVEKSAGPWKPTTPDEITEECRRVLECEPHAWWWKPRYELAVLMRGGMDQVAAVERVRGEVEAA